MKISARQTQYMTVDVDPGVALAAVISELMFRHKLPPGCWVAKNKSGESIYVDSDFGNHDSSVVAVAFPTEEQLEVVRLASRLTTLFYKE